MSRIAQFVGAADFTIPAGDVNVGKQNLSVSVGNDFDNTEALKNVAIPLANGDVIHLSDVATVSNALEDADSIGRYNGQDIVSVSIKKQQSSTAIDVSKDVLKQVSVLEKTYPGLTFTDLKSRIPQEEESPLQIVDWENGKFVSSKAGYGATIE